MIEFLNSNPIIALAIAVVVVFVLMFVFVKPGKKKTKKSTNQEKSDKKETSEQKTEQGQLEEKSKTDEAVEKQQNDESEVVVKKKVKRAKQKPEISQVYQRTSLKDSENNDKKEEIEVVGDDDDFEKRAQFVKTSNKVSKFVGFSDIAEKEMELVEELSEMPVSDFDENCELCEKKQKHFDHSRRLSKMVQDESFDDMLTAHISDKYLNINVDKHLKLGDDFSEKLFDRALKTLSNSSAKVIVDELGQNMESDKIYGDKDYMKTWLEERRREELAKIMVISDKINEDELSEEFIDAVKHDIDLSPKNIIVVDSIINRKGKRLKKI